MLLFFFLSFSFRTLTSIVCSALSRTMGIICPDLPHPAAPVTVGSLALIFFPQSHLQWRAARSCLFGGPLP